MLKNITNIVTALSAIRYLLGLIEPIRELVRTVEGSGSGAEKKTAVLGLLDVALTTVELAFKFDLPNDLVKNFASAIIDVIVAIENATGYFKHGSDTNSEIAAEAG